MLWGPLTKWCGSWRTSLTDCFFPHVYVSVSNSNVTFISISIAIAIAIVLTSFSHFSFFLLSLSLHFLSNHSNPKPKSSNPYLSFIMAEEPQKPAASEAPPPTADVPQPDKPTTEKETPPPQPPTSVEKDPVLPEPEVSAKEVEESAKIAEEETVIAQSTSFKEESNVVGELPDPQKKALDELKLLVQEALNKHDFTAPPPPPPPPPKAEETKPAKASEKEEEKEAPKTKPKEEAAPPPAVEEAKPEPKEGAAPPPPPPPAVEEVKAEPKEKAAAASTPPPPSDEEAKEKEEKVEVAEIVIQKVATSVDEDGTKTVEAIEETIVAVSAPAPPPDTAAAEKEVPVEVAPTKEEEVKEEAPPPPPEEVSIWGIPLLGDERSDVIHLKFLRARDFKVKEAFTMLKNTVRWRKEFGIEALLDEELGTELEKVVFMHGFDKENHPVCYNVYGEFQNKELYQSTFSDEEKRSKFLRWRIQFLEKSIRKLDFSPGGISTIVQINDLKNAPGLGKWEHRHATNQALSLLQDNYPEFVAKQVFINVPWWYLAFNRMISPFLTQRTKSKFVFAGLSKSVDTLFKYIAPEQVPLQYGGLSREGDQEFSTADSVTEVTIKPATKHIVEFPFSETCVLVWEVRVVGWDVSYGAEFVPNTEDGYTVIVQKTRKLTPADEPVICNSFKIGEPGKVVLAIDNQSSKKKKLLYRSKTKPSSD